MEFIYQCQILIVYAKASSKGSRDPAHALSLASTTKNLSLLAYTKYGSSQKFISFVHWIGQHVCQKYGIGHMR